MLRVQRKNPPHPTKECKESKSAGLPLASRRGLVERDKCCSLFHKKQTKTINRKSKNNQQENQKNFGSGKKVWIFLFVCFWISFGAEVSLVCSWLASKVVYR